MIQLLRAQIDIIQRLHPNDFWSQFENDYMIVMAAIEMQQFIVFEIKKNLKI